MIGLVLAMTLAGQDVQPAYLDRVRSALDASLVDYPSARFAEVRISQSGEIICGRINSRNPAGGYDGWKQMIVEAGEGRPVNVRIAQAAAVALEMAEECAARRDWREGDYSEALSFDN